MRNGPVSSVVVLLAFATAARADNPAVTVTVDNAASRHPIDPRVYGVAFGTQTQLADLNCPLNRLGGNASSRYNWNFNAYNRAADFYFESIVDNGDMTPGATADAFISSSKAASAEPLMTIPMVGWVAKVGAAGQTKWSFSVAKYGAQTAVDPNQTDAGNGISAATGKPITGNTLTDANTPADQTFQQSWVQHIIGQFGTAANGGLKYYLYDNEPSIWFASHRDVHPSGAGMNEVLSKTLAYGAMIKAQDPNAIVIGPEEWGWDGYFNSGIDLKYYQDNCSQGQQPPQCVYPYPDRAAHPNGAGGYWDYIPWLLDQLHQNDVNTGQRLLDVFAVHFYPQGDLAGRQEFSNDVTTATQLLRNRSTRNLWDPTYVDESYIGQEGIDGGHDMLIPRFKGWVNTYYPGTQVGLTEYNWGAEGHMNGATTQADILGILGREGLDLATRWTMPNTGSPAYNAFKIYRNYDGHNSMFGDVSVSTSAPNADNVAAFAAQRSNDSALTIMLISKYLSGNTAVTVDVANFGTGAPAQVWRLASNQLSRLADVTVNGTSLALTLPPQCITLLVLPEGPVVSVADTMVIEPASGTTTAFFPVTLSSASAQTVSVDFATADGTAIAGTDYLTTNGTVTFAPGTTSQMVPVTILADPVKDPTVAFTLSLSAPVGTTLNRAQATGTIIDNSAAARLQFTQSNYSVSEASPQATITVSRTGGTTLPASATWTASDGTATFGQDYSGPTTGVVSFAAGATTAAFGITINHTTTHDPNKTVILSLSNPAASLLGLQANAVLTIIDADPAGTIQFSAASATVSEGGTVSLKVVRTGGAASGVTVQYATADQTAQSGTDYTATNGTLVFDATHQSQTISVPTLENGAPEANRTFTVSLGSTGGGGALGALHTATVTIVEDDAAIQFSASSYSVSELGGQMNIAVTRTGNLTSAVSVPFACADDTAKSGVNYNCSPGTLNFAKNVGLQTFPVQILHDHVHTGNLTVKLQLSPPGGAAHLGTQNTAFLSIVDVDPAAVLGFSVASAMVNETAGTLTLNITRSGGADGGTVDYAAANGSAHAGTDYSLASNTLTFLHGETTKPIFVTILGNGGFEANRSFTVNLSNPRNGAALGAIHTVTVTIVEGDAGVQFSTAAYSVSELGGHATIAVSRTGNLTPAVTVNFSCADGTAKSNVNYTCNPGTLTFAKNVGLQTFSVQILHDGVHTGNLTVNLSLNSPTGGFLGTPNPVVLTIMDVDPAASLGLSAAAYSVNETSGTATITVKRSGVLTQAVTVDFATSPGTAVAGVNYQTTTGTLSYAINETTKTFPVTILSGGEGNLTVNLNLSNPTGIDAALGLAHAVLTITDVDTAGTVQFQAPNYTVSESGGLATITVTRTGGTGTATVNFATSDGTAVAGTDYTTSLGTLTFGPGVVSQTFTVPIINEASSEPNKTVNLALLSPGGGTTVGTQSTAALWIVE
jgi:hypothetical protein